MNTYKESSNFVEVMEMLDLSAEATSYILSEIQLAYSIGWGDGANEAISRLTKGGKQ